MKKYATIKNRDILVILTLILFSTFYLPPLFAQSPIPEGAIEWFGKGRIYDMQYSPDGTRLAVATSLGIWIYDATTYQPLHFLKKHEYLVERIVFSPDGGLLASEERFDIHLWDVNTGKHKYKLDHRGGIKHFDFSADGQTLVTLGRGSPFISTILYHVDSGAEKQVKDMPMNDIDFIQAHHTTFDRNNNILATGELDNTINLWDLVKGEHKKTLRRHKGGLNCLTFSPDGKTLASGGEGEFIRGEDGNFRRDNGVFHVWDAVKGKRKHRFSGEDMFDIRSLAFSPDGNLLAGGDQFGQIHLVDPNAGKYIKKLEGHSREVVAISFSADMRTFASGSKDGTLRIWEVVSGKNEQTFEGFFDKVIGFDVSADSKTILMGGSGPTCLWDVASGKREKTFTESSYAGNIAFIPGGKFILPSTNAKFLYDRNTGERVAHFLGTGSSAASVGFSPDGKKIVTGNDDGTLLPFDVERRNRTGQVILTAHYGRVVSVIYSPDGKTIVSGSADETIRLWDANTLAQKKVLTGDMNALTDVALSPDGKTIAAVDNTTTIYLWDVETSTQKKLRTEYTAGVISVVFSADGKRLSVGGADSTVYVLDAESGVSQQRFTGHQGQVKRVAFAADGKVLASLSDDGIFFLWDVAATQ